MATLSTSVETQQYTSSVNSVPVLFNYMITNSQVMTLTYTASVDAKQVNPRFDPTPVVGRWY